MAPSTPASSRNTSALDSYQALRAKGDDRWRQLFRLWLGSLPGDAWQLEFDRAGNRPVEQVDKTLRIALDDRVEQFTALGTIKEVVAKLSEDYGHGAPPGNCR